MDISQTTAPRSDQQNFDDYAAGSKVITVSEVREGTSEQPVEIHLVEFPGRPYKPNLSMRRVLMAAWGVQTVEYAGRQMELMGDPTVRFGKDVVGGIKIKRLSHIDKQVKVNLTVTRGRRAWYTVDPLPDAPTPKRTKASDHMDRLADAFRAAKVADALWLDYCSNVLVRTIDSPDQVSPEDADKVIRDLEANAQDGDGMLEVGQP